MSPAAVLFDFGGVLAEAPQQRPAPPELVLRVFNLIKGALTPGEIQRSLTEGTALYAAWRDEDWPDELSQTEVWERFVISGWPPEAQARVRTSIARLSYDWAWQDGWRLRDGILAALDGLSTRNIAMAVVSNTLCGAAHRDFLDKTGVSRFFSAQIYSDEAGVRKPNPQMIWHATDALGVAPADCWFIGDSLRRDVVCARRADIGRALLMPSARTSGEDPSAWPAPDDTIADGFALLDLLQAPF